MKKEKAFEILCENGVSEITAKQVVNYIEEWENTPLLFIAYNLGGVDDQRGHTGDKHLYVSDGELHSRVSDKDYSYSCPFGATRFNSKSDVDFIRTLKRVFYTRNNLAKLAAFLRKDEGETAISAKYPFPIGEGAFAGADEDKLYPVCGVRIVLKKHPVQKFRIHTAYPVPTGDDLEPIKADIMKNHPWIRVQPDGEDL